MYYKTNKFKEELNDKEFILVCQGYILNDLLGNVSIEDFEVRPYVKINGEYKEFDPELEYRNEFDYLYDKAESRFLNNND